MFKVTGGLILVQLFSCIVDKVYVEKGLVKALIESFADYNLNAIMPLLISVSMFLLFEKLEINKGRNLLCKAGAATLGVYLFHDNVNFRLILWDVCKLVLKEESPFFILISVICIAVIFVTGTIIEMMRSFVVKKFFSVCRRRNV